MGLFILALIAFIAYPVDATFWFLLGAGGLLLLRAEGKRG